ncbi:MAG TPA: glycogen debranching protein, partial [Friedmanniella sp.]
MRRARTRIAVLAAAALVGGGLVVGGPAQAVPVAASDPALARSPELSETSRLADRRTVVTGDRAWVLGTADGRFPAAGFHTRGEMGGFWTPGLKLLDGVWFGIGDEWIGPGTRTTSGWGYVRTDLPATDGVAASRTDLVPDGVAGALVGLTLQSASARTVVLRADAHSELMSSYPWGETTPSQSTVNLPDTGTVVGRSLVFRDQGTPPGANQTAHDWGAAFGSALTPTTTALGQDFRGPQDPAVVCPASGTGTPTAPARCDDTAYGRGTGGQLAYRVALQAGTPTTVWFGVGGSRSGPAGAQAALAKVLADPDAALAARVRGRERVAGRTDVSLPGDPLVERSVAWSKQMLAASVQRSDDVALRVVDAGTAYPAPVKTLDSMRWIGAGWPDYTWLFGTDGEFTAFASVAAGQFGAIEAHLRTLRDVSEAVNGGSGKIVHEVTPDGAVYFGANADDGNTDESAKYPSAVALVWRWSGDAKFLRDLYPASVRAMKHVASLDADGDGWPEGLGNVERAGMGTEKLDNTVYAIRGYADLADLAKARNDAKTQRWATQHAQRLTAAFEKAWWNGGSSRSYADSLDPEPNGGANTKIFQRHWIGLTPTDAVLPALPGRLAGPLASVA